MWYHSAFNFSFKKILRFLQGQQTGRISYASGPNTKEFWLDMPPTLFCGWGASGDLCLHSMEVCSLQDVLCNWLHLLLYLLWVRISHYPKHILWVGFSWHLGKSPQEIFETAKKLVDTCDPLLPGSNISFYGYWITPGNRDQWVHIDLSGIIRTKVMWTSLHWKTTLRYLEVSSPHCHHQETQTSGTPI